MIERQHGIYLHRENAGNKRRHRAGQAGLVQRHSGGSEMTNSNDALRACPFCGGSAIRIDIADGENAGGSCVGCTNCLASSNVEFNRKENFISNWNRRPSPVAGGDLREAAAKVAEGNVMSGNDQWSAGHNAAARKIAHAIRSLPLS